MSQNQLQDAEYVFWSLIGSNDPELVAAIASWHPCYAAPKYGKFYDKGENVRAQIESLGIDLSISLQLTHTEIVSLATDAAASANPQSAGLAFIRAAQPKNVGAVWQNPLRAISCIKTISAHEIDGDTSCAECGAPRIDEWRPISAAREFSGGYTGECWTVLRNTMVTRWFNQTEPSPPKQSHLKAFRVMLKLIAEADPKATAVKIAHRFKKELGGDVYVWRYFMETLGYAGVLKTDRQPGNLQQWTKFSERRGRGEAPPPSCHWRRSMGFDPVVFNTLFPRIRLPADLKAPRTPI